MSASSTYSITTTPLRAATWARTACTCRCRISLNRQPVVNSSNALPMFLTAPSQATLIERASRNTPAPPLTNRLQQRRLLQPGLPECRLHRHYHRLQPWGNSIYHGWQNSLTRRFSNGLQFNAAYTWSHAIDDSTADVFSTYMTPRRPEDSTNLALDRSSSGARSSPALHASKRFTICRSSSTRTGS